MLIKEPGLEKVPVGGGEDYSPVHSEKVIKNFLRERITSCIQSYRRCQAEINIVLTEVKIRKHKLQYMYIESTYTNSYTQLYYFNMH